MKKQRKRIYTALLCTCFLFSTASVPVSAAETEQEEEMTTLSSRSGEAEVSTKDALTSALGDSNISKITLKQDIHISDTLTVNRAVTLDLNGFVLRMTGEDSVIKVGQGGELTIADSDKTQRINLPRTPPVCPPVCGNWSVMTVPPAKPSTAALSPAARHKMAAACMLRPAESCI